MRTGGLLGMVSGLLGLDKYWKQEIVSVSGKWMAARADEVCSQTGAGSTTLPLQPHGWVDYSLFQFLLSGISFLLLLIVV